MNKPLQFGISIHQATLQSSNRIPTNKSIAYICFALPEANKKSDSIARKILLLQEAAARHYTLFHHMLQQPLQKAGSKFTTMMRFLMVSNMDSLISDTQKNKTTNIDAILSSRRMRMLTPISAFLCQNLHTIFTNSHRA
jgi:hypothetical protein